MCPPIPGAIVKCHVLASEGKRRVLLVGPVMFHGDQKITLFLKGKKLADGVQQAAVRTGILECEIWQGVVNQFLLAISS